MTVYILTLEIPYEGSYIEGVFSSIDLVEKFKLKLNLKDERGVFYIITEYEVDVE